MRKFEVSVSALVYLALAVYLKVNGETGLSAAFLVASVLSIVVQVLVERER